jgi:hypothetical protein
MGNERFPLVFFKPQTNADPASVAQSLLSGDAGAAAVDLDPNGILRAVRDTRGFARLKVTLPSFSFDNPRAEAAFEGTASRTHLQVGFFGNFEKVAEPLFAALTAQGLTCYSEWDEAVLAKWPEEEGPTADGDFAERMDRVMQAKARDLKDAVADPKQRLKLINEFLKGPEFRAAMAAEAVVEKPGRGKKAFADLVNCYARWKAGKPSAAELTGLRKLDAKFASVSLAELRAQAERSPRLLIATAVTSRRAAALRREAERHGVLLEVEAPDGGGSANQTAEST